MNEFINVKPLWACIQNVLPQVYDDTLGYQELLYKVISKLNELVENNNKLPDYIADLIREYISSGEIEKVLAEVLATYMLNVKFPPAGLEPASGDGSKDDTEAIQGCIDYAQSHGGMAVYFPSGSYLCNSLDVAGKCTMFGYDRYNTRVVLKGGATRPLLNGDVDEFSLNGLGFDGNMDIQVNNVNLIDITVGSGIITNVFVTDGYDLIKAQVDVDLQISDVVFNHAVENGLVVSGSGRVVVDSCVFRTVSALIGKSYVKFGVNNSVISNCVMVGSCPVGVEITGNMNHVQFERGACVKSFVDSGTGNTVLVNGVEESVKLSGDSSVNIGGDVIRNYSNDVRVNVNGDVNSVVAGSVVDSSMNKTDSVTGKRVIKSGSVEDSTTGARSVKSDNVNDTVTNGRVVVSGSVNDSTTGARVIKSADITNTVDNDAIDVIGGDKNISAETVHITAKGDSSAIFNTNYNETVIGNKEDDYRGNVTKSVGGNKTETVKGVWQETANDNKVEDFNGNVNKHVVGTTIEEYDSLVNKTYKKGVKETVTGGSTETVTGEKEINSSSKIKLASPKYGLGNSVEYLQNGVKGITGFETNTSGEQFGIVTWIDPTLIEGKTEFVTPEMFGAKGDGVTDDAEAFQSAINTNKRVLLTHGKTYVVGKELQLKSGSYIDGDNAFIKASDTFSSWTNIMMARNLGVDSSVGGYDQNSDIVIKDVIFNANRRPLIGGIGIGHAHNVYISGCEFYNWASWHPIELNSTLNGVITDCYFHDMPLAGQEYGECVQIDLAGGANIFNLAPYDNTPCRNILICNNRFELDPAIHNKRNVQPACIGSHSTDETDKFDNMHHNIIVSNNVCYGAQTFVLATNWRNSLITGNMCSNIRCGVYTYSWDRLVIENNNFYFIISASVTDGYAERGIFTNATQEGMVHGAVIVRNNVLERTISHGIALSGNNVVVENNYIRYPNYHGIYVSYDADLSVVTGNVVTVENSGYRGIYINPKPDTHPVSYVYGNVCEKLSATGVASATEKSVVANNIIRNEADINTAFLKFNNVVKGALQNG